MIIYRSRSDGAPVNILDMNYKEIRMKFKTNSVGMFYCDSEKVTKTEVKDPPPEYTMPPTVRIPE